jgi:hypothetical protein
MDIKEKWFFKSLILPESKSTLYWNNRRYSKEDIIDIKRKIEKEIS